MPGQVDVLGWLLHISYTSPETTIQVYHNSHELLQNHPRLPSPEYLFSDLHQSSSLSRPFADIGSRQRS